MRKQTDYYEVVGTIEGDIYMLDYIFIDGDFKGATGTIFQAIHKEEYDERMQDKEYFKDWWVGAIESDKTTDSFEEWLSNNDLPNEEAIFDLSNSEHHDKIRELLDLSSEEYPIITCIGGGRCFSKNMKFDKVFNKKLIEEINKVEGEGIKEGLKCN